MRLNASLGARGGAIDCTLGRRILIASRRHALLRAVEARLVEVGYQVEVVTDGLRALKRAQESRPDLVVTQILLPSLDGLELIRRLRADPATSSGRILVFSILDAERRALQAGADRFIGHPLRSERLVEAIMDLLGSPPQPS